MAAAANRHGDTFRLSRAETQAQHKNRKEDEHLQSALNKINVNCLRQQKHFKEKWREYQASTKLITASSGYLRDRDVITADKYTRYHGKENNDMKKQVRWQVSTPVKKSKFRRLCASAPAIKITSQPRSSRLLRFEAQRSTEINLRMPEPPSFTKLWSARAPSSYNSRAVSRMQSANTISETLHLVGQHSRSSSGYASSQQRSLNEDVVPHSQSLKMPSLTTFITQTTTDSCTARKTFRNNSQIRQVLGCSM